MSHDIYHQLFMPIEHIDGIGSVSAKKLQKKGYHHVGDLLFHLPKSWIDDRTITPVCHLTPKQPARIQGEVSSRRSHGFGRKATVHITLTDDNGHNIELSFFHAKYMMTDARLSEGQTISVRGTPDRWGSKWQMTHPEWSPVSRFEQGWIPKYPSLAGFNGKKIGAWIERALSLIPADAASPLDHLLQGEPTLLSALKHVHLNRVDAPDSQTSKQHFHRLQLEELLVYFKLMQEQRKLAEVHSCSLSSSTLEQQFITALPYELTDAQKHVWSEIGADLESGMRMHRLLQGDVGAGKTWIAALSMVRCAAHNKQSAMMAPTEVLAQQHFETLHTMLAPHGIAVALLTGSTKKSERKKILEGLATGEIAVLVGTHALLTEDVIFHDLVLAMIDEQHRFGVAQRWALSNKGEAVHLLAMTATPIPRTLALSLYGDMDLSIMQGLPAGRKLIETRVLAPEKLSALAEAVDRMLAENGRIYWIVPRIDEDEDSTSVEERLVTLKKRFPNELVLGLHGKMKSKVKQEALAAFADGRCRILVSTTVVEVGVNVPEARVIIIEHAEMYGLAQLHQLRGRVGRSSDQSFCILIPSAQIGESARERLTLMTTCHDGLQLAESDLERRGAGDAVGTRQSGEAGFRLIDPALDAEIIRNWAHSEILSMMQPLPDAMVNFWRPLAEEVD